MLTEGSSRSLALCHTQETHLKIQHHPMVVMNPLPQPSLHCQDEPKKACIFFPSLLCYLSHFLHLPSYIRRRPEQLCMISVNCDAQPEWVD